MSGVGDTLTLDARLVALLRESLIAWGIEGAVEAEATEPGGAVVVTAGPHTLRVTRADAGLPFRWMVAYAGRTRAVTSVAGVLRTVRAVLQPDFSGVRLRIGFAG